MNELSQNYVLGGNRDDTDAIKEYQRLEFQNSLPQYRIGSLLSKEDLDFLNNNSKILDLGFGGGYVTRWLLDNVKAQLKIKGVDSYAALLNYSLSQFKENEANLIEAVEDDFRKLSKIEDESQDAAFTRYTAQHVPSHLEEYFSAVYKKLKPGGKFIIIDGDGISSNLRTNDPELNKQIIDFSYNIDSYSPQISPSIHSHLISTGFEIDNGGIRNETKTFSSADDLKNEREVWDYRFLLIRSKVINFFKTEKAADSYIERYLENITKTGQMMYFTNFCFIASKPR